MAIEPGRPSETEIMNAYFDWVGWKMNQKPLYSLIYSVKNEGKRSWFYGTQLVRSGLRSGIPDVCIPIPTRDYGAAYLEFKTLDGQVSPMQKVWLSKLKRVSNYVGVVKGLDHAKEVTESYMDLVEHDWDLDDLQELNQGLIKVIEQENYVKNHLNKRDNIVHSSSRVQISEEVKQYWKERRKESKNRRY